MTRYGQDRRTIEKNIVFTSPSGCVTASLKTPQKYEQ